MATVRCLCFEGSYERMFSMNFGIRPFVRTAVESEKSGEQAKASNFDTYLHLMTTASYSMSSIKKVLKVIYKEAFNFNSCTITKV